MPTLAFQNTPYFADLIRYLRENVVKQPRPAISTHGGPSVSLQNDIETGKAISITEETLGKYSDAFDMLAPGNAFISFIDALGTGMLHIDSDRTVHTRRHEIADALSTWNNDNEIYLGIDIKTGENVSAHALVYPTVAPAHLARALADRRGAAASIDPLLKLALRQQALTLIPQSQQQITRVATEAAADPAQPRTVHTNPERNFDPLTGITSLQRARQRAQVLGADPDKSAATAWIILLANAIGAEHNNTPLLSWIHYRSATAPWVKHTSGFDEPLRAGLPAVSLMLEEAETTLGPWARLYGDSLWDVQFTPEPRQAVTWQVQEIARPTAPPPQPEDIWIYDSTATNQRLGHVLHDTGIPNIMFADAQTPSIVHSGSGFTPKRVLHWCPLGPDDRFALVYHESGQPHWRALQLA